MAANKSNHNKTGRNTQAQEITPRTPSKRWLATLTEKPLISPAFSGTLALAADNQVHAWIVANAPAEIVDLYRGAMSLRSYEDEFESSNGMVSSDANSSILETIAEVINALDHLGDEWIITTP